MTDPPPPFGDGSGAGADPDRVRQAVDDIAARDPRFNLDAFLAEAQQAFWLVGQAHAKCKPELCLGVLSPALGQRQRSSIDSACQKGQMVAPEDGDADSGRLVSVASDANNDTITVHFTSIWKPVSGGRGKADRRVQNWCFQRPATANTAEKSTGDRCGNCGAALVASAGGTCRFCGTAMRSGDGWRVIRVDEVREQEAASAVAAMQAIVSSIATAAREAPSTNTAPPPRRSRAGGIFKFIVFLLVVVAGLGVYAVKGTGPVHNAVAKFFPSIRHAQLQGPLDLTGAITAQRVAATHIQPILQPLGTCAQAAHRTTWDFKSKLPDGSTMHLKISLPPGTSSAGPFKPPPLSVTAYATNASQSESWRSSPTTPAVLTVAAAGGGDITFTGLVTSQTGTGPLSGHLSWTCSLT